MVSRPQSNDADFYRELGHLFGVPLSTHNRWAGAKVLREEWLEHIDRSRTRPVLIIDEAQEMKVSVLCALRILSSMNLDARAVLTLLHAALRVTEAALREDHPIGRPPILRHPHDPVLLAAATLIADRCHELRSLLDFYDAAVDPLSSPGDDPIPF